MAQNTQEHILYLASLDGQCHGIQLSMELWNKVEAHVKSIAKKMQVKDDPFTKPQPLDLVADLKKYWDFTYPYEPHVHCDACGASSDDWENDPLHPFHLTNANIGGLLVFRCRCGATVRKKNFHKKVAFECTRADN